MTGATITQSITEPLTAEQADALTGDDGYLTVDVVVAYGDLLEADYEEGLDLISRAVVGNDLLMDFTSHPVGVTDDHSLILRVTGDPSNAY